MNKVKNKGYNYAHTCVCDPDDGFSLSLNGASLTQQGGEGQRGRTALQHPVWLARGQKEHRARDPRPTPPEAGQTRQRQQPSHAHVRVSNDLRRERPETTQKNLHTS